MDMTLTAAFEEVPPAEGGGFVAYTEELPGAIPEGERWRKLAKIFATLLSSCWNRIGNWPESAVQGKSLLGKK
jgi:hypothetical protein